MSFTFSDADGSVASDGGNFDVNTAKCDGGLQPVPDDQAVWVSGSSGDDSTSCTRTAPCKTISAALAKAQSANIHVAYLDSSTFAAALTLGPESAGLTIQGGWSSTAGWAPNCDDGLTRIEAPADAASAAVDIQSTNNVTLRLLTVESKPTGGVGESLYAVRVRASQNVLLDNVALSAGSGGSGAPGGAGSSDGGCSPWPANGMGGAGDAGAAGALAVPGQDGFVVSSGGTGASGDQGTNSLGTSGACANCINTCQNCSCTYANQCGASGGPGCSGNGGAGGQGGQGGGVSVALYVSDSSVTAIGGSLHAGPGGPGASGGNGAPGGLGTQGAIGSTSSCYTGITAGTCINNCFCYANPQTVGGGIGGDGGPGGTGGQGGGGAGGSVFLWAFYGGSTVVNIDPSTLAASSFVGPGGAGGQPNGVSGVQANHP